MIWREMKLWLIAALLVGVLAMAFPPVGRGSDIPEETAQPCIWIYDESECFPVLGSPPAFGTVTAPTPLADDGSPYETPIVELPGTGSGSSQ